MRKISILTALLGLLLSSCTKEGPVGPQGPPGPAGSNGTGIDNNIYNKWKVVYCNNQTKPILYLIVNNDNSFTELDSFALDIRKQRTYIPILTNIQFSNSPIGACNYYTSNDTLRLTNAYSNNPSILRDTIILKKTNNIPSLSQWVTVAQNINIVDSLIVPVAPLSMNIDNVDFSFDGNNFLLLSKSIDTTNSSVYGKIYINRINPVSKTIVNRTLTNLYGMSGISFGSNNIWGFDNNKVYKINNTTGSIISSSPTFANNSFGLSFTYANQNIWTVNTNAATWDVNSLNPVFQNQIPNNLNLTISPNNSIGAELVNGYLYFLIQYGGKFSKYGLMKCQISPFRVLDIYDIDNSELNNNYDYRIAGLSFDGNKFWIGAICYNPALTYRLYKLNL